MGAVYEAFDELLRTRVALKVIRGLRTRPKVGGGHPSVSRSRPGAALPERPGRHLRARAREVDRRQGAAFAAAIVALVVGASVVARHLPRGRPPVAAHAGYRRSVAIVGFAKAPSQPDHDWVQVALSELLTYEVRAAESSLRAIDGDRVRNQWRSLGLTEEARPTQLQGLPSSSSSTFEERRSTKLFSRVPRN
jgi:hypothetical protein